ncbi:MAG: hypothetical protein IJO93_05700 [Clostridia bacterium]|nr:hypothetical protein [Clostridia bacterium]
MSIICTTYTPEAIVMAADSRVSVNMNYQSKNDSSKSITHIFPMSDNVQKVFLLKKVQVGISAVSGFADNTNKMISQYIDEFEKEAVRTGDSILDVAEKLSSRLQGGVTCHVAGYDGGEPFFYSVTGSECKRLNVKNTNIEYGITWSGEVSILQKLMMADPKLAVDFKTFSVTDTVEFTEFLINTVIGVQRFEMKPKTCGGAVDLLVLRRDGAFWHKHKVYDRRFMEIPQAQRSNMYITDQNGNTIN